MSLEQQRQLLPPNTPPRSCCQTPAPRTRRVEQLAGRLGVGAARRDLDNEGGRLVRAGGVRVHARQPPGRGGGRGLPQRQPAEVDVRIDAAGRAAAVGAAGRRVGKEAAGAGDEGGAGGRVGDGGGGGDDGVDGDVAWWWLVETRLVRLVIVGALAPLRQLAFARRPEEPRQLPLDTKLAAAAWQPRTRRRSDRCN